MRDKLAQFFCPQQSDCKIGGADGDDILQGEWRNKKLFNVKCTIARIL